MSNCYYNKNAKAFIEGTLNVDMEPIYKPFLSLLTPGTYILDAGCGSGRDSKAFIQSGYKVYAFDASEAMAQAASEMIGQPVGAITFMEYQATEPVGAIWACASLLHVPATELPQTFIHLAEQLVDGGLFYCSFKYGDQDHSRGCRDFTNATESRLAEFIANTTLQIQSTWTTADRRTERKNEFWLNALLVKKL